METARTWLREAHRIVALTGAGISAESGIPTFRGASGLWRRYRPEELATPEAFARDPKTVWEWYAWRREIIAAAQPNAGHIALARLEELAPEFLLVTQNVDGLHDRAGSRNLRKLHGDIWMVRCLVCLRESRDERIGLPELPPRCACGGVLRPGVVWFGEALPEDAWLDAERAVQQADVLLVVGTSAAVWPAAGLVPMARTAGAKIIEVNPEETAMSRMADRAFRSPAAGILPQLVS